MSAVLEKRPRAKKKASPIANPASLAGERQQLAVAQLVRHPDNRQPSEAAIAAVAAKAGLAEASERLAWRSDVSQETKGE